MQVKDIKEHQWFPPSNAVQVFPAGQPQVARIRMGALSNEKLQKAGESLKLTLNMEPVGNDGVFYWFQRKQIVDAYSNPYRPDVPI